MTAASSPALSNNSNDTGTTTTSNSNPAAPTATATTTATATPSTTTTTAPATPTTNTTTAPATSTTTAPATSTTTAPATPTTTVAAAATNGVTGPHRDPPKNLRGLNKPKCSQCGNVARSRCPYQSCKSCCAKAQNPCHIHVLKSNATLPDKTPSSNSSLFIQQSADVSSSGASLRVSTLRQLSQFQGSQIPIRTRRPLTRKDAAAINQWRFSKLKEYKENNIEAENEAFNRYMQNVSLLEEAFSVKSLLGGYTTDSSTIVDEDPISTTDGEENMRTMILGLKARLRSNPRRVDASRERIRGIVDQGLKKLRKWELNEDEETTDANDLDGPKELRRQKRAKSSCMQKALAVSDLIDKLNKARTEDDLQSCSQMKSKLFDWHEQSCPTESALLEVSTEQTTGHDATPRRDIYDLYPALCNTIEISQETLNTIENHFLSLDQIEYL